MARLPRASFALMLALLPMLGTVIGAIVLDQLPTAQDLVGITLVVAGVALHQLPADAGRDQAGAWLPGACASGGPSATIYR